MWLLLGSFYMANFEIVTTGAGDREATLALKPYHISLLVILGVLLHRSPVLSPQGLGPKAALLFFANGLLVAYIVTLESSIPPATLKFATAAVTYYVAYQIGASVPSADLHRALRLLTGLSLVVCLIKAGLYFDELRDEPTREGWKPDIPLLFPGGVNIEATLLALGAAFHIGRRTFAPYWLGAAVISVLYLSRASTIAVFVLLAVAANGSARSARHRWRNRLTTAALGLLVLCALLALADQFFLDRFMSVGHDSSSNTRLQMIRAAPELLAHRPYGWGAGNAVPAAESMIGEVRAGNLHNLFAQAAVDYGLIGLGLLIVVFKSEFRSLIDVKRASKLRIFVGIYLLMGLVQFTPIDTALWLFAGLAHGQKGLRWRAL